MDSVIISVKLVLEILINVHNVLIQLEYNYLIAHAHKDILKSQVKVFVVFVLIHVKPAKIHKIIANHVFPLLIENLQRINASVSMVIMRILIGYAFPVNILALLALAKLLAIVVKML